MVSFNVLDRHVYSNISLDLSMRITNDRNPHERMTLQEFCDAIDDHSRIYSILDMPTIGPSHPPLIRYAI